MQGAAAAATASFSSHSAAWATARCRAASTAHHAGVGVASCSAGRRDAIAAPLLLQICGSRQQPPSLSLLSGNSMDRVVATRTAAGAAAAEAEFPADDAAAGKRDGAGGGIAETVQLGAMIVAWYLLNIYFNIYNKLVLKALPFPYTMTAFQLAFGSLLIFLMWATRLHPVPKLSPAQLAKIAPLAAGHMLGTVFTNMSLGKVAVSFTHTVKASEPFFTVLLSAFFLGETPSLLVLSSLVPIVGALGESPWHL